MLKSDYQLFEYLHPICAGRYLYPFSRRQMFVLFSPALDPSDERIVGLDFISLYYIRKIPWQMMRLRVRSSSLYQGDGVQGVLEPRWVLTSTISFPALCQPRELYLGRNTSQVQMTGVTFVCAVCEFRGVGIERKSDAVDYFWSPELCAAKL